MASNRDQIRSEVRGPTSALTAFLRSKNIRVPNASRFRRRDEAGPLVIDERTGALIGTTEGDAEVQAAVEETTVALQGSSASSSRAPTSTRSIQQNERLASIAAARRKRASMNFEEEDDSDEEDNPQPSSAKRQKVANDRGVGSSRNGADITDDASAIVLGDHSSRHIAPGSIDFCAACAKRFTVTAYTHHTEKGGVCHRCTDSVKNGRAKGTSGRASGSSSFNSAVNTKPTAQTTKSKARRKPNQIMFEKTRLPSLQSMCINIIADNIEDVEGLIGIANQNMDSISKSISKNRRLNSQTVNLFLQSSMKHLRFYDCSALDSDVLASIPSFCPFVESINLQLCGMLDNAAIDAWGEKCKNLTEIELYGPFLVRVEAWHRFFNSMGPRLTSFKIRESPRFDKSCCEKLVECCPNLTELGLAQIGPLDAECLLVLKAYGQQLTYLDISDPGVSAPGIPPKSLEDGSVIDMLEATDQRLQHLDLSRNADLTGKALIEGILANCVSLKTLNLIQMNSEEILPEQWVELFQGLKNRGSAKLTHLNLERCLAVDDAVIESLIDFCGKSLIELNLNSCNQITEKGFKQIALQCPNLTKIDVGFCRAIDDGIVMDMINNMRSLKEIWLFSCNKISTFLTSNRVRLYGKEKYARA